MNNITIDKGTLTVEPQGLDKLFSFKGHLTIPVSHVAGATFDPGINSAPKGIRDPGLSIPGKYAGTFVQDGEKSFWNVSGAGKTIVIQLANEDYDRLVLTVDEPRTLVDQINNLVQQH
jgi:hypothetical protein